MIEKCRQLLFIIILKIFIIIGFSFFISYHHNKVMKNHKELKKWGLKKMNLFLEFQEFDLLTWLWLVSPYLRKSYLVLVRHILRPSTHYRYLCLKYGISFIISVVILINKHHKHLNKPQMSKIQQCLSILNKMLLCKDLNLSEKKLLCLKIYLANNLKWNFFLQLFKHFSSLSHSNFVFEQCTCVRNFGNV